MSDLVVSLECFMGGAMLALMALGLGLAIALPSLDHWSKRFFIVLFSLLTACMIAFLVEMVCYWRPEMILAERAAAFVASLLISVPIAMMVLYLLHCCGEDWRGSTLFRVVLALWVAYLVLLTVAQFTTYMYHLMPGSGEVYGPGYPLLVAPLDAIMVLNLAGVHRRRERLTKRYHLAFLVYLLPLTVTIFIHTFAVNFPLVYAGITLFALSMFGVVVADQVEQNLLQQREIAHQRASILVLQMRPHFIYNTMASIYYLCEQDPKLAQRVTMNFTTYLRKNFTAIASEDTIAFSEELEHARAYLAVEQAQFEDDLLVEYDTPHMRFRVPPLTLQPIVENAVKHGMDPDGVPLHIWVRTRKTDRGSQIVVEDDGSGFAPAGDGDSHTALANIEQRLKMMCGGRFSVEPRAGGGTVVKVTIPE